MIKICLINTNLFFNDTDLVATMLNNTTKLQPTLHVPRRRFETI